MRHLIPALLFLMIPACNDHLGAEEGTSSKRNLPSKTEKDRAKTAASRVTPSLQRDLNAKGLKLGEPVFLRAFKKERTLEVWVRQEKEGTYKLFRSYPIAAQSGGLGSKLSEGDGQVPEGFYFVGPKQLNPQSRFHLSFNIGYPNAYDRHHGRTGSFIMVHGNRVSIGCLAMTDEKIEEIYTLCAAALNGGQPFFRIHIFPFKMSGKQMKVHDDHRWAAFWKNLKPGYDWFESKRIPPDVEVKNGKYTFRDR